MNRVAVETDIRYALRDYYATRIAYPQVGNLEGSDGIITLSGDVGGIPYGQMYAVGDPFIDPVGDGQLGLIYHVVQAHGNTLTLKLDESPGTLRPKVTLVDDIWKPEVKKGRSAVYIGIRSRPVARAGFVRGLFASRELHNDGEHFIITEPFWRGTIWLHVDGTRRQEVAYVFEMLNTRIQFTTGIYKFLVSAKPAQASLVNFENGGLFRNVLSLNIEASLTAATPLDQLPDGMPEAFFPWNHITGVSPVIEPVIDPTQPMPYPAEKVGDYPLSDEADAYQTPVDHDGLPVEYGGEPVGYGDWPFGPYIPEEE